MKVHQVMVGASPGDAVTSIATAMDDLLRTEVDTAMWAMHLDHRCLPRIRPVWDMPRAEVGTDDVVIYHCSIGEPVLTEMVLRRPERLVVHYHNITPPHHFEEIDPRFARLLAGREEMAALVRRAELVLADSTFNAADVLAVTDVPVRVTPPPLDLAALSRIEPHGPTLHHLTEVVAAPVILHVGQLLPHKRPDLLVAAMKVLRHELGIAANLTIVGPHRNRDYAWLVERYVAELAMGNVWLAGESSAEELAAHFRTAALFATASEHEGFCLPLVEAFAFDLPVVARWFGAIPETVGPGGLVLPCDAGPEVMAEAFARVLTDPALRDRLVQGGRDQLERFSMERSQQTMRDALRSVVAR